MLWRTEVWYQPEKVAKDHEIFGCDYVGLGWYGFNDTDCRVYDFVEKYKSIAERIKAAGKYFMYHNHDSEFKREDGIIVLEKLSNIFTPDEMGFTIDTYWVQRGGGDPVQNICWWSRMTVMEKIHLNV